MEPAMVNPALARLTSANWTGSVQTVTLHLVCMF
jgi:hypothetical protein